VYRSGYDEFLTPSHYAQHSVGVVIALPASLQAQLLYVVVDAYSTKAAFIKHLREQHLQLVSKLRVNANLKYLHQKPNSKKPGRPKRFARKVDF
jgi:hypothetical protein